MLTAKSRKLVDKLGMARVKLLVTDLGALAASPASLLTDELRALIRADKDALIEWVRHANESASPATTITVDIGTIRPTGLSPKLLAASMALDLQIFQGVSPVLAQKKSATV